MFVGDFLIGLVLLVAIGGSYWMGWKKGYKAGYRQSYMDRRGRL